MRNIKAKVVYNWDHPRHKFFPGDQVKVYNINEIEPNTLKSRLGQSGTVIARSSLENGLAREGTYRQWTRYYVQFPDGEINGFFSWYLTRTLRQSLSY